MPISPFGLLDRLLPGRMPHHPPVVPALPLQGLTILAVEDSRFASDAVRLMCQRSGARLRRVDTLQAAYAHLQVYRPDVMLIDLGLPDGCGEDLIRDLTTKCPAGPVVIGISGSATGLTDAMQAGAKGFIEKPFPNLAAFQTEILRHLPDRAQCCVQGPTDTPVTADPLALRDDLQHAEALGRSDPDPQQRKYLAEFVTGIARSANDPALVVAAQELAGARGLDKLNCLLAARIHAAKGAFKDRQSLI